MTNEQGNPVSPSEYHVGDIVQGVVSIEKPFGWFVQITDEDFGILKVTNLFEAHNSDQVRPTLGGKIRAVIIEAELTEEGWKLNLSLKRTDFLKYGRTSPK